MIPRDLPKAELHCHLQGTAPPALIRRIAERNGMVLPHDIVRDDDRYAWDDFAGFFRAFDVAALCLRTPEDYHDITLAYLTSAADEGAVYVELFSSPALATLAGLGHAEHLEGIAAGIADAERACGIVGRLILTCQRHLGPERAREVVEAMVAEPHPYVVGLGMSGDETKFEARDFATAYRIAANAGYGCTAHAGEIGGAESVAAVIEALPVTRIGHGVRAIEDAAVTDELRRRGIVLEVCPTSNVALGVYPDLASHPFRRLLDAGCRVTLNSDDPPYFGTTLAREYEIAAHHFGLDTAALLEVTRTALRAAFVDDETRERLLTKVDAYQP
jgi:adenosine deaminase